MPGYEVEMFFESPDENLICCICLAVLKSPKTSACGHCYCESCILSWLRLQPNSGCPECRKALTSNSLVDVPVVFKSLIQKLKVKCENYNDGCTQVLTLETYPHHLPKCGFRKVLCDQNGCEESIPYISLKEHRLCCPKSEINCKYCDGSFYREAFRQHSCSETLLKVVSYLSLEFSFPICPSFLHNVICRCCRLEKKNNNSKRGCLHSKQKRVN
eukprot:TRINITY_DN6033_c0_g1::TRINITY_DN6033_c0_g1_i1::g.25624::m.25624 TRINITY_DN6033_c0_g1::TRINITY_DN6033_c0_g1_i1::g.25624  ORF type:complete len:227 (+),score=-22.43,sp/Q2KHN1/RN151_HUMAN/34.32/1e-20,zf-TRAF/PF02176.13/42,zf-TRAF/PF02176.13/0.00057,zf-TRAF/PF02176.13/4e-06,zf-TRAF/PF02176.13/2.8e+03,zf-C3HC4/PF00097.20/1.6e-06,zf-C3HC4/PF00097.20/1.3e+04,zf-C3HC4/PF00097.20/1.4e+03,zf-RING_2/PF13639.1/3.6e-06,zf-RING_2/PF13639.1/5e+03,zf-RING_2/PF13639.1/1.5e+04,zf-C3HC4_2/PF13923.1/2.9e-05,zf-C3HC